MPIYFAWFTTALLSVGSDANDQNLPQSGRLLYCVGSGFINIIRDRMDVGGVALDGYSPDPRQSRPSPLAWFGLRCCTPPKKNPHRASMRVRCPVIWRWLRVQQASARNAHQAEKPAAQ